MKSPVAAPLSAPEPQPASPVFGPLLPEPLPPDDGGAEASTIISIAGTVPPEQWNRLGTRLIPKMRAAGTVTATISLEIEVDRAKSAAVSTELRQIIDEIGLSLEFGSIAAKSRKPSCLVQDLDDDIAGHARSHSPAPMPVRLC